MLLQYPEGHAHKGDYMNRDMSCDHGPGDEISYEEIIDDQINQTTKLLNFCDLPWSDDCKNFQKNNSPVKTLSVYQSRKPIYNSSKNVSDKFLKFLPFLKELDI